jgi:cell division protein FtsI/penicillin-binding protein 2
LQAVVAGGTGMRARIPGINVGGKTGTAQLASNELLKSSAGRHMKDNAWFFGFAPVEAPEIVVVALFEGGEHGNLAAPIVRDVIKAHFDKKLRKDPKQMLAALPSFGPVSTVNRRPAAPVSEVIVPWR